jgi:phosphonate transport system permease protein
LATDRRFPIGVRGWVLLALGALGGASFVALDIPADRLLPDADHLRALRRFFAGALRPALDYEAADVPADAEPFLLNALKGAHLTVVFAVASLSLALVLGVLLGFLASTAWWSGDPAGGETAFQRWRRRVLGPAVYGATRVVIVLMRSIHELIWAVIFLAAVGLSNEAAVVAIAIPYAGTLAKVFSEMIDEAPRNTALALRGIGASNPQVFLFGLLPRALPDMGSYAFYRLECALRSSAIIGFFGPGTLGRYIRDSWQENLYGQVWTYLYLLFALVVIVEWWSGRLRMRGSAR